MCESLESGAVAEASGVQALVETVELEGSSLGRWPVLEVELERTLTRTQEATGVLDP